MAAERRMQANIEMVRRVEEVARHIVYRCKRPAYGLGKLKDLLPADVIICGQTIVKYAANPAGLVSMFNIEIVVGPHFKTMIKITVKLVAN